ncbi:hypothetical protein Tco_0048820, partial [Tanacetum coccineum]
INHKKEKRSRRKTMPFPRFTKLIINHFLSKHQSLNKLQYLHTHTIKDDGIVSRLKFVRISEDYQDYRLPKPESILTEGIKQSESYQMFIKYSTSQTPPKKSRGKGSQGKKTTDTPEADVDVSEKSDPKPTKKKTTSRRVIKKKLTIYANDNIILDPDVALELGKSISLTKAKEEEAVRQVHATYARIMIESVPSLLEEDHQVLPLEILLGYTMQALKESKKTNRRQPGTGGSSEGTGWIPGVPDESIVVSATSSKGIGTKPTVPVEEKVLTKEKVILEWGFEQESKYME